MNRLLSTCLPTFRFRLPGPVFAAVAATVVAAGLAGPADARSTAEGASVSISPDLSLPRALAQADTTALDARPALTPEAAVSVVLRRAVTVSSDMVLLRDLFAGTDGLPAADVPVAAAPQPGARLVLDAAQLRGIATEAGLSWSPASEVERSVITRDTAVIGAQQMVAALRDALAARGVSPEADIDVNGGLRILTVPAEDLAATGVASLDFDPRSGRFSALIEAPLGSPQAQRLHVTGRIHDTVEVPVLARSLGRDDVIGLDDLDWMRLRRDRLPGGALTDLDQVLGLAATRTLRPGEPLRHRDLVKPSLVRKGQAVTLVVETAFMTLQAQGRALENGAEGEAIRLENVKSGKIVTGRVIAERVVIIDTGAQTAQLMR